MPLGNQYFNNTTHYEKIRDGCEFFAFDKVLLVNKDFRSLNYDALGKQDFVYLDPPYSNTLAIYNEQQGWSLQDDSDLFVICDKLTSKGVMWGLSNVFENKGVKNQHLIDWVKKNNYKVKHFSDFTYMSCGKGNANTDEVYIYNYDIKETEIL